MKIWMISREYDGIAEAGGVKNVVCSLSEELSEANKITLFIPEYGCTDFSKISDYEELEGTFEIPCNGQNYSVSFAKGICKKVQVIFVKADVYKEKNNVYTYNRKDLEKFPDGQIGTGYKDSLLLDVLFQKAVCVYAQNFRDVPDVIHCHDACVASFPAIAKVLYSQVFNKTKMVVTIHNAGPAYHHEFCDFAQAESYTELPGDVIASSLNGQRVEPYLLAINYAKLSTVSYDYAKELLDINNHNTDGLSEAFCQRNVSIEGITNGIDINRYSPENKNVSLLPFEFSPVNKDLSGKYKCRSYFINSFASEGNCELSIGAESIRQSGFLEPDPLNKNIYISFHGRLVRQKGILVILDLIDKLFAKHSNVRLIINGQGEQFLQDELSKKAAQYPGKIVYLCGYERSLARLCTACGDFALFPSEFEPCGLEDFIAQIYGTIPVAHATGGLKKIVNGKSGFTYSPNNSDVLLSVIDEIVGNKEKNPRFYDDLVQSAALHVKENYTWKIVANKKYIPFYRN
ncbi:glycogen synthase [Treponema sp.]|uniref:glycogen synthase n=1 Tax=Treponema sp. TaxID=166 RepID=UPI00298D842A|nr:glycogen/starch synthase [Treponema sp.]